MPAHHQQRVRSAHTSKNYMAVGVCPIRGLAERRSVASQDDLAGALHVRLRTRRPSGQPCRTQPYFDSVGRWGG